MKRRQDEQGEPRLDLEPETVRDLEVVDDADEIRGGSAICKPQGHIFPEPGKPPWGPR